MSYLIIGGLSPLSLRGVIPQLLKTEETKKVVIYDDLSGGSSSSAAVLSDPRVTSVVVGSTFNEKLLQKTLTDNEITHVIDFASLSSPKETSPIAIARTAVVGFTHVLDAVRHYGGKPRFVLVSREPSSTRPLSEHTPPVPNSLVAANAMAVESMLHSYVISYRLPLVVARLSEGVLAHDLSRGLNSAFSTPAVSSGDEGFSAISVGDAARGILAVLDKGVAPEIYNIGGEMAVSQKAVKECIDKIKAGSNCTISSNNPSAFPIERALKELGWAPEEKNLCEVLKSEVSAAAAAPGQLHSFSKVLLFGADQNTGKRLLKALEAKSIPVVLGSSHPGEDPIDTVKEEIFRVAPSNIVFVGDRSEDPAYFDQEPKPARLKENVGKNLHAPWILAAICERVRCHFAYVQTYKEETEEQLTSEGVVKGFTKRLLEQFTSAYQTRYILAESSIDDANLAAIVERITLNKSTLDAAAPEEGKTCTLS